MAKINAYVTRFNTGLTKSAVATLRSLHGIQQKFVKAESPFFAVLSYASTADAHSGSGYSVAFANFTCGLIFLTLLSLCIGQILNHVLKILHVNMF